MIRKKNNLKNEKSSYLIKHSNNPVNWYPWNDKALNLAAKENKVIILSIGYSTCHWCHVMERESFQSEPIAKYMNKHFISIKVIQINRDRNNQLKNTLNIKLEDSEYKEGELFIKRTKRIAVINSINVYLQEIDVLQFIHLPLCKNQLIKGTFSFQVNLVLHFGQKLLGLIIDKSFGKR